MISFENKNRIWLCGIADAIGMIILILTPILFDNPGDLTKLFTTYSGYFVFGILPLALLACWRGMKDATKIMNGNHVFIHVPFEGFLWGFITMFMIWFASYLGEVFAAGGNFDEVISQPTNIRAWLNVLMMVIPFSLVAGVIGAFIATLIHLLNKFLIAVEFSG